MTVTETDQPTPTQAHALEGIVRRLTEERDDANTDRARLFRVNVALTHQVSDLRSRVDELEREQERHRRADLAAAAVRAAAAAGSPRRRRRPLTSLEQLFVTLAVLGGIGAVSGFASSIFLLAVGGLAVGFASLAAFLVCRTAPDPGQPFSLDEGAAKWETQR